MITAVLCRHKDGALASCRVSDMRALHPKGADIICAAVSTVMRTTVAVLEAESLTEQLIFIDNSNTDGSHSVLLKQFCLYGTNDVAADYLRKD